VWALAMVAILIVAVQLRLRGPLSMGGTGGRFDQ
jgi:hypothetical protein